MKKRIAILGAGPIGLEAALAASEEDYEVQVFERGGIGQNILEWGHVRMFSTFGMNSSERGRRRLGKVPDPTALLTGREYVECYLKPLGEHLDVAMHLNTEVISVGRVATLKGERIGEANRDETPLRVLVRQGNEEWMMLADAVLDCTGVYRTPNYAGDGGMPAAGELLCRGCLWRGVPDVAGVLRPEFEGKSVLVVGNGHSAATMVSDLAPLAGRVVWATRRSHCVRRIPNDPLPGRDGLLGAAEALVRSGRVEHLPEHGVLALHQKGDRVEVTFTNLHGKETVEFDRVVSCTGFRPNLEITRELQSQTCWATEGTYKLAAALLGETAGDCLAIGDQDSETLTHPEPGFFTLGVKSYGRHPDFLIQTGLAQVENVMALLAR